MAKSLSQLERDALQLPAEDRARLAVSLLCSLEDANEDPEEVEKLWVAEAVRRAREMKDGSAEGIPAEEVLNRLRSQRNQ
jgi:putative addiction module component (TIGR02574 family)